ncbi:MAG: 2-dehydropantoate 2-reductase [Rectinema sp.]
MDSIHSTVIVGAGAIGASIAARLLDAGHRVSVSARGERAARYQREGFVVNGRQYFLPVTDSHGTVPADLVLVAVKNYSLDEAIAEMRPYVGAETIVLSLLNGVDAVPKLREAFGPDAVPYAMILGIDAHRQGNEIQYSAKGQIFCGFEKELARKNASKLARMERFFRQSDILFRVPDDIVREVWFKFMINVSINQWSAVLRAPYQVFQTSSHAIALLERTMKEVIVLSQKIDAGLTEADIAKAMAVLRTLGADGKTSMLQDVDAHRRTEVEAFAGTMVRLAGAAKVEVPINTMLYEAILAIEDSYKAQ